MNQFDKHEFDLESSEDEEDSPPPQWIGRLMAIILLLVFLLPPLLYALQITIHFLQPQIQPTPVLQENLLHG